MNLRSSTMSRGPSLLDTISDDDRNVLFYRSGYIMKEKIRAHGNTPATSDSEFIGLVNSVS